MKKVVVIGSNSFSGSDFIAYLLEKKTYQVLGVSRSLEKSSLFLPYKKYQSPNYAFFQCDLNHDIKGLEEKLDAFSPEYIVNFAAQSEVGPSWKFPHHWYQTNVVGLTRLCDMLKNKTYLQKYVHISSPEVYGTCSSTLLEDAPVNPTTPYAASKAAGDLSLYTFYKNYAFPLVMIRSTNVYGAYQQLFKIIPRSILYIKQNKKIPLHGGGKAVKSYIHIRDVSKAEHLIMEKGEIGQIYHVSPDKGVAVQEVVRSICRYLRKNFSDCVDIVEERLGQDKAYLIDSTKLRNMGWRPEMSLEKGIEGVVHWVEENYEELIKEPLEYEHKP